MYSGRFSDRISVRRSKRQSFSEKGYSFTRQSSPFRSDIRTLICLGRTSMARAAPHFLWNSRRMGFLPIEVLALPISRIRSCSKSSWTMLEIVALVRESCFARSARDTGGWFTIYSSTKRRLLSRIISWLAMVIAGTPLRLLSVTIIHCRTTGGKEKFTGISTAAQTKKLTHCCASPVKFL